MAAEKVIKFTLNKWAETSLALAIEVKLFAL